MFKIVGIALIGVLAITCPPLIIPAGAIFLIATEKTTKTYAEKRTVKYDAHRVKTFSGW